MPYPHAEPHRSTGAPVEDLVLQRVTSLPRGSVRLIAEALHSASPGYRWVCWGRAAHLVWQARSVHAGDRRMVVATIGGRPVALAYAQRFHADVHLAAMLGLLAFASVVGVVLALVQAWVPSELTTLAALTALFVAVIGALRMDGPKGQAGARAARNRAREVGPRRAWGRGIVAVTPEAHGRGIGGLLSAHLVVSLPLGDVWIPVALSPAAERVYARLGARPLEGAATEVLVHPVLVRHDQPPTAHHPGVPVPQR